MHAGHVSQFLCLPLVYCALLVECFTTPPTNITVISSQRPEIEITWEFEAPANSERWSVLYRVTVSDGTSDVIAVSSSNETTATLPNLNVLTSYTLYVTAFTETGCVTGPISVDITVMESECRECCVVFACILVWCFSVIGATVVLLFLLLYWSGGRYVGVGIFCCFFLSVILKFLLLFVVVIDATNNVCCYLLMLFLLLFVAFIGVAFIGVVKVPLLL